MFRNEEEVVWLGIPRNSKLLQCNKAEAETISKVGGDPIWLDSHSKGEIVSDCRSCGSAKALIVQVYAPVSEDSSRILYVFACTKSSCTDTTSWEVIRSQKQTLLVEKLKGCSLAEVENEGSANAKLATNSSSTFTPLDSFSFKPDTFETDTPDSGSATEVSFDDIELLLISRDADLEKSKHSTNKIFKNTDAVTNQGSKNVRKNESEQNIVVNGIILDVVEEPDTSYLEKTKDQKLLDILDRYRREEGDDLSLDSASALQVNGGAATCNSELYEEGSAKDQAREAFQDRIGLDPSQCIRYAYGGEPLWPIPRQNLSVKPCESCGSERKFELQLMPGMLTLELANGNIEVNDSFEHMDWSSALVYSCENSCDSGTREQIFVLPPIT